jgi:hypothetical protein
MRGWLIGFALALCASAPARAQEEPPQAAAPQAQPAPSEAKAWAAVHRLLPRNTAMNKIDGQWFVTPPNKPKRAASPAEVVAIADLEAAILAQRAADRAALRASLTDEERVAVDAADDAIRAALPPGAWHKRVAGAIIVILADKTERAATLEERPALERFYALADQIEARLRRADIDKAVLRILPDEALVGAERTAEPGEPLWTQQLVFSRNVALSSDLVVQRGRIRTAIEAGAKLFVTAGPKGQDAFCLPRVSGGKNLLPGYTDWFACFLDADGDGALDKQTNGGKPNAGVFLSARGFRSSGVVLTAARMRTLAPNEGFRQRIGPRWSYTDTNKQTGERVAYFELIVAPEHGPGARIAGVSAAVPLDAEGRGEGQMLGARFAVEQSGGQGVKIRILKPMPEQGFSVRASGESSYIYELR